MMNQKKAPETQSSLLQASEAIGCNELDLLKVMFFESNLKTNIRGGYNNAYVGLIQFSANTAKWLGTSQQALLKMSFDEQLYYVVFYFTKWKKQFGITNTLTLSDLYLLVLYPSAYKVKGYDAPLSIPGKQAKSLYNKSGFITRKQIEIALNNYFKNYKNA